MPFHGTARMHKMTPWRRTSTRSTATALTARGLTTSPLTAKRPTTFARPELPDGAACPATTDTLPTKCQTPVLMEDGASTPTAIT